MWNIIKNYTLSISYIIYIIILSLQIILFYYLDNLYNVIQFVELYSV